MARYIGNLALKDEDNLYTDANGSLYQVTFRCPDVPQEDFYYLYNGQGDVVALIDYQGNIVVEYTYDTWGRVLTCTGPMASTLGALQPFRYRGYVYDTETGWYYLKSRYYNPTIGRFLSADSFASTGQGVLGYNMYAYCLNNPACMSDGSGYVPVWNKQAEDTTTYYSYDDAVKMAAYMVSQATIASTEDEGIGLEYCVIIFQKPGTNKFYLGNIIEGDHTSVLKVDFEAQLKLGKAKAYVHSHANCSARISNTMSGTDFAYSDHIGLDVFLATPDQKVLVHYSNDGINSSVYLTCAESGLNAIPCTCICKLAGTGVGSGRSMTMMAY